jgi:hypothetical protein
MRFFVYDRPMDIPSYAHPDANAYLSIFGDAGKLERHHLTETMDRKRDKFEKNSTDRFQIFAVDVGKVRR